MSSIEDALVDMQLWIANNYVSIIESIVFGIIIYFMYKGIINQLKKAQNDKYLDDTTLSILTRFLRWGAIFLVFSFSLNQLGIKIDNIVGFLFLASGTVIGFAAMNTLGNAIAGLILMFSKPFKIGDRLRIDDEFVDVVDIDLIFTRMKTPDNVHVSIPNQKLIQTDILDYGRERVIRRRHELSIGYSEAYEKVEQVLLESLENISGLLSDPSPFVLVTDLKDYAVEYTLFVFINEPNRIIEIDSEVRKAVLIHCEKKGLDLSTPSLIRTLS